MRIRFDVNDPAGRRKLIGGLGPILEHAEPARRPLWGAMTLQQMVEHLLWTFEISTGRVKVVSPLPPDRQEKARAFLLDNRETPRGYENPLLKEGLPSLRFAGLGEAVAALHAEARRFLDLSGAEPESSRSHPIFGNLSPELWSRTHFKHCAHHLLQFGLVEVED